MNTIFTIILVICGAINVAAFIAFLITVFRRSTNFTQGEQVNRKLQDCETKCYPLERIKMNNGKDGMTWGGNDYTIKTKR